MTRTATILLSITTALCGLASGGETGTLRVHRLSCEYEKGPVVTDVERPGLGWTLESSRRADRQTAYRVMAASSREALDRGEGDLWDSGIVQSAESVQVTYGGKALASGRHAYWRVRVWDAEGRPSPWSPVATFAMGLLEPEDWKAIWIRADRPAPASEEALYSDRAAPQFRREFEVSKPLRRASLYVSGLGYHEVHLNGAHVSDELLDPPWTEYSRRVFYATHDVTGLLRPGRNAIGVVLGNGWYWPLPLRMWGHLNLRDHLTVGEPRLILQLALEFEDGTRDVIATDPRWKWAEGPVLRNNVYLGELYDARREIAGWDAPGFDDAAWGAAVAAPGPIGQLEARPIPAVRVWKDIVPPKMTEPSPGVFIFDMGQNLAGCVTLVASGPAGTRIRLRYGELLYADGTLNPRTTVCGQIKAPGVGGPGAPPVAWQEDTFVLAGQGKETYRPRFTFHGFRYVEVSNFPGRPGPDAIRGHALSTDVPVAGKFTCSEPLLLEVQAMVRRTFLANLFGVQSDCPGREKFGYGGDIVATSEAFLLNFDMARFYAKTVRDFADAARPDGGLTETAPYVGIADEGFGGGSGPIGWGTVHPLLLFQLLQYHGNRRLVAEQYETVKRWVDFLEARAPELIVDRGISDHESLAPKPRGLTGTAFFFLDASLAARLAERLGRADDARRYGDLARRVQRKFNERFLDPVTGRYGEGTQASQAFPLYLGLVPEERRHLVLDALLDDVLVTHGGHLTTGIFGTRFLLLALSDSGRADVAYTVASQRTFPGWGHMIERGATTLWEHWEFSDDTYSHDHPMFGSVSEWLFKCIAGIRPHPDAVGFDRIIISPHPVVGLTRAAGEYESVRGEVASSWRVEEDRLHVDVTVPVGATAEVHVPVGGEPSVTESGLPPSEARGIRLQGQGEGEMVFAVQSGSYSFVSRGWRSP